MVITEAASGDIQKYSQQSLPYLHLLNEPLGLEFASGATVGAKEERAVSERRAEMLFALIQGLADFRTSVIIIDDARFLDRASWDMARGVVTGCPPSVRGGIESDPLPLMLVLATRPLKNYMHHADVPKEYMQLCEASTMVFVKLPGLPQEQVEELVCDLLGQVS